MAFEFEALVGHLYIVGGRAISATPPGALVEVAPKRAARGREMDTFFVLILPSGERVAPGSFYEQMARLAADQFFENTGSVTSAMRAVFNHLNENLYQHNSGGEGARYEASILCAVLRGADLYLGKVGSGVALFRHDGETIPFPAEFSNDDALFGPPLGVDPLPTVKMARYEVITGTRLVLADTNLADVNVQNLENALAGDDVATLLTSLKGLIATQATLMAVEFVPPELPVPFPVREGESTVATENPAAASAEKKSGTGDRPRRQRPPSPLAAPVGMALSKGALGLAGGARMAGRALDYLIPEPKEDAPKRRWWATPFTAGAAIAIPIIVVVLVVIMWVTGTGESEFDLCVQRANDTVGIARGIASSDVGGTIAAWSAVIEVVEECNAIRQGDPTLAAYTLEGQQIIDRLLQVDRRSTSVVASFPNAGLRRVVLQGEDMYLLDDRNDLVYRIKIGADGTSVLPGSQQAIASMRRTASVAEFTVGDIIDITWAADGAGLSQANILIALDANGVIVECPPRFMESLSCAAQQLPTTQTWVEPVAIGMWQGRLYVLDPGANQLWRYEPGRGAFSNSPTEYFVGENRPDITSAVDFEINAEGQVFVLLADGTVMKFQSGEAVPFDYASFPDGQEITSANAMFLNNNPVALYLYIVSQPARTIYEMTTAGTFIASYRAQDEELFNSVTDVIIDSNQRWMYALSGNTVLAFLRTP